MTAEDLARIAAVRSWCASGRLAALVDARGVSVRELAATVRAELGGPLAVSSAARWLRGERMPTGERALALFRAAEALAEGVTR